MKPCKIGIVDDHPVYIEGLRSYVTRFGGFEVVLTANDGSELLEKLKEIQEPLLIIMDLSMKGMDGFEATRIVMQRYPETKILALSNFGSAYDIIQFITAGGRGYLLKMEDVDETRKALMNMQSQGFYFSKNVQKILGGSSILGLTTEFKNITMTPTENEYVQYACSDDSLKIIASKMSLSESRVDDLRKQVYHKLQVKSRQGLVIYALTKGLVRFH